MRIEGRLATDGRAVTVEIRADRIAGVESSSRAGPCWIAPGLLDLQVNGFAGHDMAAEDLTVETVAALAEALWERGTTRFCPTLITLPEERILHNLDAIAQARAADPLIAHTIPGVHIEGPHISVADGPRGAHSAAHIRPPDIAEFERWQKVADGAIRIVTLAPELPGAVAYIRHLAGRGVIASIGHTAAGQLEIDRAVAAGARLSTHLGNGSAPTLPRLPNPLWPQLAEDRLTASFIADGHHLLPAALKAMLRAKGADRSVLVSDSTALAGMPPGRYDTPVGGRVELTPDGRLDSLQSGTLAGSAASLADCVANIVRFGCGTVAEAVRLGATNPAQLLDPGTPAGKVAVGSSADLTVFELAADGAPQVTMTVVGGDVRYRQEG